MLKEIYIIKFKITFNVLSFFSFIIIILKRHLEIFNDIIYQLDKPRFEIEINDSSLTTCY